MHSIQRITSRRNARIKEIRALAARRRHRRDAGLSLVEGPRWLEALVRSPVQVVRVLVDDEAAADGRIQRLLSQLPPETERLQVTDEVMAAASPTRSPQGMLAVVSLEPVALSSLRSGLWVVANGLQDPGNLGTIIRCAAAFGAQALITTPGTVDWLHPAVLRAGTAAVLKLGVAVEASPARLLAEVTSRGGRLLVAEAQDGLSPAAVDWSGTQALVLGHEVRGVEPLLQSAADVRVTVPMPGAIDSLNVAVATGIILYEAARRRQAAEGGCGED